MNRSVAGSGRVIAVAIIAVFALAVGVWVWRGRGGRVVGKPAGSAAGPDGRRGAEGLVPGPVRPMRMASIDAGPESVPSLVPPGSPPTLAPGEAITAEDFAAGFATEARNPEWAAGRERELREVSNKLIDEAARRGTPGVRLGAVECKSRICRLQVSADDDRGLARVVDWMGDEQGFQHLAIQMHVARADDHGVSVFLRFGR